MAAHGVDQRTLAVGQQGDDRGGQGHQQGHGDRGEQAFGQGGDGSGHRGACPRVGHQIGRCSHHVADDRPRPGHGHHHPERQEPGCPVAAIGHHYRQRCRHGRHHHQDDHGPPEQLQCFLDPGHQRVRPVYGITAIDHDLAEVLRKRPTKGLLQRGDLSLGVAASLQFWEIDAAEDAVVLDHGEPPTHERKQVEARRPVRSVQPGAQLAGLEDPHHLRVALAGRTYHHLAGSVAAQEVNEPLMYRSPDTSGEGRGQVGLAGGETVSDPILDRGRLYQLVGEPGGERVDHGRVLKRAVHRGGHGVGVIDRRPRPRPENGGQQPDDGKNAQHGRQDRPTPRSPWSGRPGPPACRSRRLGRGAGISCVSLSRGHGVRR